MYLWPSVGIVRVHGTGSRFPRAATGTENGCISSMVKVSSMKHESLRTTHYSLLADHCSVLTVVLVAIFRQSVDVARVDGTASRLPKVVTRNENGCNSSMPKCHLSCGLQLVHAVQQVESQKQCRGTASRLPKAVTSNENGCNLSMPKCHLSCGLQLVHAVQQAESQQQCRATKFAATRACESVIYEA